MRDFFMLLLLDMMLCDDKQSMWTGVTFRWLNSENRCDKCIANNEFYYYGILSISYSNKLSWVDKLSQFFSNGGFTWIQEC